MPCHQARDLFANPASAAGAFILPPVGVAVPRVATERARPACPARGGRGFFLAGDGHTVKQQNGAGLSDNTFSGHACAEPSRFEQVAGGIGIVLMVLVPLLVLSHGWPLTMLLGGGQ